jgi:hypothetical protein
MAELTRFYAGAGDGGGAVTASHYTHDGWVAGTSPITLENAELVARVDGAGRLIVETFDAAVSPIEIPQSVFGKPAQLKNVRLTMTGHPITPATWIGDDEATATLTLALDLEWAIAVDGAGAPLGTQHLPPFPIDVHLTGAGDHVDAELSLDATGDLWSWAGLVKLSGLELSLTAGSLDP